jgi:Nucleoside transporter
MHEYDPASVFGFAVNGLLIFTSVGTMIYGHKLPYVTRIAGGYLIIGALMIVLPLVTNALESGAAFGVVISILVVFGVVGGIVQASTFAMGGMLPGKYMGGIMLGQGLSGIILNLCRILTLIIIPHDLFTGALVYFILAGGIMVICAIGMCKFIRLEFVQYYFKKASEDKMRTFRKISGVGEEFGIGKVDPYLTADINKSEIVSHVSVPQNAYLPVTSESERSPLQGRSQKVSVVEPKVSPLMAFLMMMKKSFIVAW